MEFTSGNKAKLTPSEARWIATYTSFDDGLRRRAEQGRRTALQAFMPEDAPAEVPLLPRETRGRDEISIQYTLLQILLHRLAQEHGVDEAGTEQHIVNIELSNSDLERVADMAALEYELMRKKTMDFSTHVREDDELREQLFRPPYPVFAVHPGDKASIESQDFELSLAKMQVTGGLVDAILKHRNADS